MGIPFDLHELEDMTVAENPFGGPPSPVFAHTSVTSKENYIANTKGEGHWVCSSNDALFFHPSVIPDNPVRAAAEEADPLPPEQFGGTDMFGIEWTFEPEVWGSMETPGQQLFDDANDWCEAVKFPDVDGWDWAGSAAKNQEYLSAPLWVISYLFTGYFERLISFMDFEDASMALIDDDQKDAVRELFEALTDLYIDIIEHYAKYFPGQIDEFVLHDDWGSQMAPFFSAETVEEMIVPAMARFVARAHELGYFVGHHCCGNVTKLFDAHHACGFDKLEAQKMIDKDLFYEKYGNTEMLTISPDPLPEDCTEEQARQAAREFVDKYFNKGKRCLLETYYEPVTTEFLEELYIASRKKAAMF